MSRKGLNVVYQTCLVSLHGQIIFVLCFLPSESLLDEDVEGGF
jgi:hypothetical protein